jgi:hypothetical protein
VDAINEVVRRASWGIFYVFKWTQSNEGKGSFTLKEEESQHFKDASLFLNFYFLFFGERIPL